MINQFYDIQVGHALVSFKVADELYDDTVIRVPNVSPSGIKYGIWSPQRLIASLIAFDEDTIYTGPYDSDPKAYFMVNSDVFWRIRDEIKERRAWQKEKKACENSI